MFQTLDEEIERTEGGRPPTRDRLVQFAGIVVAVVVFGGLWLVIVALE